MAGQEDVVQRVLVLNCGSSSVKYRLLEPATGTVLAGGLIERIGEESGRLEHRSGPDSHALDRVFSSHADALDAMASAFASFGPSLGEANLVGVGHRVVHGGERFSAPALIDDEVLDAIEEVSVLAPLHNPANLEGIRTARAAFPDLPHVAVFDTAFHAQMPARAATYAVPEKWRSDYAVRRYGFHGTSHGYVSRTAAELLGRQLAEVNTIVLHLGNGASACAVQGGRSIDTSMGLTPVAGLVMGTRSGDVDPALPAHLSRVAGLSGEEVDTSLNRASGMLALAGVSDMREVLRRAGEGDPDAELALDVYCYRVRCYVGAYHAALGRLDAIAFTAGIGERSAPIRARALAGLEPMGISVDPALNVDGGAARLISPDGSRVAVLVVPTDEEREIATQTLERITA
jgi:acetate kinase